MGRQIYDMYEEAKKIGGLGAQIRLAILTMLPSTKAMDAPDSDENIAKFRKGMKIIHEEFNGKL